MAAGHLVPGLQLAFHRHEDLDHFHHARTEVVATLQFIDFVVEAFLELGDVGFELALESLDVLHHPVVGNHDLRAFSGGIGIQHLIVQFGTGLQALGPAGSLLVQQQRLQAGLETAFQDRALVVAILGQPLDLCPFNRQGAFVLVDTAAREHPNLDHRATNARRQLQRRVADVGSLLAENRA